MFWTITKNLFNNRKVYCESIITSILNGGLVKNENFLSMIFSSTVLTVVAVGRVLYWVLLYNTKWEEGWKKMVLVIKGMCQWWVVCHQLHVCRRQAIFAVEVSFIHSSYVFKDPLQLWKKESRILRLKLRVFLKASLVFWCVSLRVGLAYFITT